MVYTQTYTIDWANVDVLYYITAVCIHFNSLISIWPKQWYVFAMISVSRKRSHGILQSKFCI